MGTYCIRYWGYNLMNKRNIVPALMGRQILVSTNQDNTANWMCAMEEKYRLREKNMRLGGQQTPVCRDDLKAKKEPLFKKWRKSVTGKKNVSVLEVGKTLACAPQARWARRRVKRGDVETRLAPQDLFGHGQDFGLYVKCSQKLLWGFHQKNDMIHSHF